MKNLYLIEYGCSICSEHLVVLADSLEDANEYAYLEAQNIYYSYDCNYPDVEDYEDYEDDMSEDDIAELMQQDMEQDIHYYAVEYDPENEDHQMTFDEQNNKPFEV
jgi:hypothetical protein